MSMHFDTVAAHQKSRSSVGCMLSGQTSLDAVALAAVAADTVAPAACARALAGLATPAVGDMALIAAAVESLAGARVEDLDDDHPLFAVRDQAELMTTKCLAVRFCSAPSDEMCSAAVDLESSASSVLEVSAAKQMR